MSPQVPDFLAKLKASLAGDILPLVQRVAAHTRTVYDVALSWATMAILDMFDGCERAELDYLKEQHK